MDSENTQQKTDGDNPPINNIQTSSNIENLEARNITLKQKEEDNKLSFGKNQ
jgi:hypothetical protein